MVRATCPRFKARSLQEENICRYWEERNPQAPALCTHPHGLFCETRGRKIPPRDDRDDDGSPD